jgi:LytS/YehU family sensor histidine kinase
VFSLVWLKISRETFRWAPINKSIVLALLAAIIFTLVYEILYLSKEGVAAKKIVKQLDVELTKAEITASRTELDPHFIFNSLNTLSQLITHDSKTADSFNNKLAQVYKYFLINKERELITIDKEIEFATNYFFLLKTGHDVKMELYIHVREEQVKNILIVPCALQTVVESIIKRSDYSQKQPYKVFIKHDDQYLIVETRAVQRMSSAYSDAALKNLEAQYLVISQKSIVIEEEENKFLVKLPLIKIHKKEYA